jgi:2',3'-cyclic-nucleotide 2'-phosphodiesterase (5'-nucleotidase family)
MNTRRKFLANGSMAAAALLASKPFKAIAGNSYFSLVNNKQTHLVFIHTAGLQTASHQPSLKFIGAIKNKTSNAIVFDAGNSNADISFDASISDNTILSGEDYRIITKGGVNTGIITIAKNQEGIINKINNLAALLKTEKGCQVVVCVSQLGFSHKNKTDDKELAAKSKNIDIIIGAHAENFSARPLTLPNCLKQEVIIQSAASSKSAFGKIELGFDAQGNKNHVHVLHKVPQKEGQQTAIIAA